MWKLSDYCQKSTHYSSFRKMVLIVVFTVIVATQMALSGFAQDYDHIVIGMGDSIGEGVQSGDASWQTQYFSYLHIFSIFLGAPFPMPYLDSNPLGVVGEVSGRSRLDPSLVSANLSVSGATVHSLLYDQADGITDSETDLILQPSLGSQMEIAESLSSALLLCWIGNNDALKAVTSYDQLNATQMTPINEFQDSYFELVQRLFARRQLFMLANIPDIDKIALLVDRNDLIKFTGSDYGLPEGHLTTVIEMVYIMFGLDNGSNLQNPDYVLDPGEQAAIQARIDVFNQIIDIAGAAAGMPVVDINGLFDEIVKNPPTIAGITLTNDYLGGIFSLDGVHPSNIGHALIANAFIDKINTFWGAGFPRISEQALEWFVLNDPFVDKDGDGVVPGRPFTGLLETLCGLIGISGDSDDAYGLDTQKQNIAPELLSAADRESLKKQIAKAFGFQR